MVFLPNNPGLDRRMAYGNYVRRSRFRNNNNMNINNNIQIRSAPFIFSNQILNEGLTLHQLGKHSKVILKANVECSICYENDNLIVRRLSCGHEFHIDCIDEWLSKKKTCPICRKILI